MPDFNFDCPHCGQNMDADTGLLGMEVDCPGCGKTLAIPGTTDDPPCAPEVVVACANCGSMLDVTGQAGDGFFECPVCQASIRMDNDADPGAATWPDLPVPERNPAPVKSRRGFPVGRALTAMAACGVIALAAVALPRVRDIPGIGSDAPETEPFSYTPPSRSKERQERLEALRQKRDRELEAVSTPQVPSDSGNPAATPEDP